jgi:hypothetical protein
MYEREALRHAAQASLGQTIAEAKVCAGTAPHTPPLLPAGLGVRLHLTNPRALCVLACPQVRALEDAEARREVLPASRSRPGSGLRGPSTSDAEALTRIRERAAQAQAQLDTLATAVGQVQEVTMQQLLAGAQGRGGAH